MWPLLAELGVALLKQDANNRDIDQQRRIAQMRAHAAIDDRRAARAGDSGYIQNAIATAQGFPRNPDNGANMLLGVGAGLLKQNGASAAEDAAHAAESRSWRVPDDDLIDPWSKG